MATSLIHPNSDDKSMTNPDPWNGDLDWFVNDRVYTLASPPWTTLATRTPFMNNTEDWRKSLRSSFYDGDAPLQSFYGRSRRYGAPHCTIFTTASLQLSIIIIFFIIIIIKGAPISQPMHSSWKWKQSIYGWAFYWKIILLKEIGLDGRIFIFIYILKTLLI